MIHVLRATRLLGAIGFVATACLPQSGGASLTGPLPSGGHRVLFIGNSLTYVNGKLPRQVDVG